MTLSSILEKYSHIQLANPSNQEELFSVIERSSLSADALQISFERRPDFFSFLKAQGERAFVFTFHNDDQSVQGFACLSFRNMKLDGQTITLGYASDLRTTSSLGKKARLQWRKTYAELIQNIHLIEEFNGSIGAITAVWSENAPAQKSLVSKKRAEDFTYVHNNDYVSCSVWGRWNPFIKKPRDVRPIQQSEIPKLKEHLFANQGLRWDEQSLEKTLQVFGKTWSDFYVIGNLDAFVLPALIPDSRKVVIKKWPKTLAFITKILPMIGRKKIELNSPLSILQLLLFHSLQGNESENLLKFANYFWSKDISLLNINTWNTNFNVDLKKRGYLLTSIKGTLFKVESESSLSEFKGMQNFKTLEMGFL